MNSKYKFAYRAPGIFRKTRLGRILAAVVVLAILGAVPPATAVIQGGGCVNEVSGDNNNCTANDLTFVAVGLGVQDDGCVDANDTVSIFLRARVSNTTAQTRYDVGLYFATDGDPNGDGALSGVCAREILKPVGALGVTACPPLDLNGGGGPFFNSDGDACADLINEGNPAGCDIDTNGLRDPATFDLTEAISFDCDDTEIPADGFVNIPLCGTWGNQNNQVGGATCDSEVEAVPGTKSKCRCENLNSNIPAPRLALSCSCAAPTTVRPGFPVTCTVSYANNLTCTPDGSIQERFQCGTASFIRFDLDDNRMGAEAGTFAVNNDGRGSTAGTPAAIQWTPASDPQLSSGIIGQGESDSLEFVYTVSPNASDGPVTITTQTIWSNASNFSNPVTQSLSTTCDITVDATHATVSSFGARADGRRLAVEWQTASETGTAGFDLYRLEAGEWVRVNERLLPATGQLPGASYRFLDPDARPGGETVYKLVEEDVWGRRQTHGPYRVSAQSDTKGEDLRARRLDALSEETPFEARPKPQPQADRERFEAARREREERLAQAAQAGTNALRSVAGTAKPSAGAPARARIDVAETGLIRVAAGDLAGAWNLSSAEVEKAIRQGRVRLTGRGTEIGWHPTPPGDGLLFYAEGIDSLFSAVNAYFVELDRGTEMPVVRLKSRNLAATPDDTFTDSRHFEQDLLARPVVAQSPAEDYWFWAGLIQGHPTLGQTTLPMTLDGVAVTGSDATLTVRFRGLTTDLSGIDHRAEVRFDGSLVGEAAWEGVSDHDASFSVSHSLLSDGPHTVEVVAVEGTFFVDSFDLRYARRLEATGGGLVFPAEGRSTVTVGGFATPEIALYEITDPRAVRRLDGAAVEAQGPGFRMTFEPPDPQGVYLALKAGAEDAPAAVVTDHPSQLKDPAQRADYLVIAPDELTSAAEALADLRRNQGLEAQVVALPDVYDELGHGVASPEAIRAFLETAWRNWALAPRYVTLIGKGSYDYRDLLGQDGNLLPPRMVTSRHGLVPSDSSYAIFDGSALPRMAVGRLPVVSAGELLAQIDKIAAYEAGGGAWTSHALLVTDNPDSAGNFPADADLLAATVPGLSVDKIYLGQPLTLAQAQSATLAGIQDGARLLAYVGHGGLDRLAAEGILTTTQIPALDNGDRLPVVAALTCNLGMFAFPGFSSLGEALVIEPDGGGAAVWGPMGLSLNQEAVSMAEYLLPALAAPGAPGERLGDRLLDALEAHLTAGGPPEVVRIYGLLGDSALEIP